MRVPDKFPEGCKFFGNPSGDDFVEVPDGACFKLSDDGSELMPRPDIPRGAFPGSEKDFAAYAKSCRALAACSAWTCWARSICRSVWVW
jgi:hypothetical protein